MARPRALTPKAEAEIVRLLGTGTSAEAIARRYKVDRKTVAKLIQSPRTQAAPPPTASASSATDEAPTADPFEAAQLRAWERLRQEIDTGEHDARGLAQLVKAQNDTIKAIRLHRLIKGRTDDEAQDSGAAERVMERLRRLQERAMPVAPVEATEDDEDEAHTGT